MRQARAPGGRQARNHVGHRAISGRSGVGKRASRMPPVASPIVNGLSMDRTVRHRMSTRRRHAAVGYALLLPSLIGVGCFLLLPVAVVLWLSVHSWNLLGSI